MRFLVCSVLIAIGLAACGGITQNSDDDTGTPDDGGVGVDAAAGCVTSIAFRMNDDIYRIKPGGTELVNLTEGNPSQQDSPHFSTNGQLITYRSDEVGGLFNAFVMRANGEDKRQITLQAGDEVVGATWLGAETLALMLLNDALSADIVALNANGSGRATIQANAFSLSGIDASIAGQRIAYAPNDGGLDSIATVDFDGTGNNILPNKGNRPHLSADGSKLVYYTSREGDIHTVNVDGTNDVNLTADVADADSFADWSPDDSQIFFRRRIVDQEDIFVMNADGSEPVNLTASAASEGPPEVSPDNTLLAFSGAGGLIVARTDGTGSEVLPDTAGALSPTWQPCQ